MNQRYAALQTLWPCLFQSSWRIPKRTAVVGLVLCMVCLASTVLALTAGPTGLPVDRLYDSLLGRGNVVEHWTLHVVRLPRALAALGAGALLGVSGALFQSISRNPLGSPDIIGLMAGASAGAVAASLLWTTSAPPLFVGAVIGASLASLLVWLTAGRSFAHPYRLVVAGIGVGALALALVQFALSNLRREHAQTAAAWLSGSLAGKSSDDVWLVACACLLLLPVASGLTRALRILEMGDDLAHALGVHPERTRHLAAATAVWAAAAAVAVTGPVAFVALAAPQIALRCTRLAGPAPWSSALMGAGLLSSTDVFARHIGVAGVPVGIVTAGLGGIYLAFLLAWQWKKID